jgi:hypothetical protein
MCKRSNFIISPYSNWGNNTFFVVNCGNLFGDQSSMKIMYIFFSYSVHNFNLNKHLVKILFSIKIILWFFTRFEYLLLLRKLKSNYLSFSLLLLEQIPFCPSQSSQGNFYLTGHSGMWKTSFAWTDMLRGKKE